MRRFAWLIRLFQFVFVCLALVCGACAQEPAEYQVIRVAFRLLGKDGRPVQQATMCASIDSQSSRLPPDRVLKAKIGDEEYTYNLDDTDCTIFSLQQSSSVDGRLEVPIIVFSNRPEPIDYRMSVLYGKERHNRLESGDMKRAFSQSDAGNLTTLVIDVIPPVPGTNYAIAALAWLGASVMGALLFFRGVYKSLLAKGKSIDLSRALCWSGALLVCLLALGLVYWVWLPHVLNMYLFFAFLGAIWVLHLLFTVIPKRA